MFNKTIIIGNLTKDIHISYLQNGTAIGKGTIASNYKYKSTNGEQKEEVCFLDFNLFGRSAEIANQYLHKGSKVLLEGRLILESWTDSTGNNKSKHSLRVENMKMLGNQNESYQNNINKDSKFKENTNQKSNSNLDLSEIPEDCPF